MPPLPASSRVRRRASVLVVVLVICLGLVSLALLLGHSMLMAYRGADNELAARQADAATLGAVQYAESLMTNVTNPGDVPDPTTYNSAAVPVGDGAFWFVGEPVDATNIGVVNTGSGSTSSTTGSTGSTNGNSGDQPTFGLVDEASKLNLNRATFDMISLLPNMTSDLAQAIVTWRTAPSATATPATSGSSTAGASITSGPVKQGFMESVDELGLVIGGTDNTLLYGDDVNLNHVLDPEETSTAGSLGNGQFTAGLMEYCTVYSREPNTASDGTARTPANSLNAVPRMLDTVLGGGRGNTVRTTIQNALRQEGIDTPVGDPPVNTAWVNSVLEFDALSGLSASDLATVNLHLANGTGNYTTGLINVNTASQAVLACVPGIGDAFAAALVSTRAARGASPDLTDWSWVVTTIGKRNCRTAGPYLTTRSYQLSADVAAVGRFGRGYRRTRFVIDASTGTPQVVYRRDLSYLGWALGRDERTNLQNQLSNPPGGTAR